MKFHIVIISKWFLALVTRRTAFGMAIWPFIFIQSPKLRENKIFMNHERIHLAQQIELLIIPFYLIYVGEYFWGRIKGLTHGQAYLQISFEREAFTNEMDLEYLEKRKFWAWVRYFSE